MHYGEPPARQKFYMEHGWRFNAFKKKLGILNLCMRKGRNRHMLWASREKYNEMSAIATRTGEWGYDKWNIGLRHDGA